MRLSILIALLITYIVGCLAVAFAAVFALEQIIGDMGTFAGVSMFAIILVALATLATPVFNLLSARLDAKERARTGQLMSLARQSAADLPAWSNKSELEAALRHAGLEEWASRLAESARRCILLIPGSVEDGAGPIGASRLGGQPDMPPDLE